MNSFFLLIRLRDLCSAVLVIAPNQPRRKRPFRVPLGPVFPVLGIRICLLLMFSLPAQNWWRLLIWLGIGLVVYFSYGRRHSVMSRPRPSPRPPRDP